MTEEKPLFPIKENGHDVLCPFRPVEFSEEMDSLGNHLVLFPGIPCQCYYIKIERLREIGEDVPDD